MAVLLLLGPGMWGAEKGASYDRAPIQVRRDMAKVFRSGGHKVLLMEDEPDRRGEDLIQKFDRLLRGKVTDVLLYWPPAAKMQTTYDELILLYDRQGFLREASIDVWVLHHVSVAAITKEEFKVLESGSRSRYLTAVAPLGVHPLGWKTDEDLKELVGLLSAELDG